MNKTVAVRIAYYLKKVAEKGSVHPAKKQPRSFKYRNERLSLYKKLMHEQIEAYKVNILNGNQQMKKQ